MTYILLDSIRSAFNVGSIFRSADGAGNCTIYICGISPTPENPKVQKTSLFSQNNVDWQYFEKTEEAIEELKKKGIKIYSIEKTDESIDYKDLDYPSDIGVIFGHEKRGISKEIQDLSDKVVSIEMKGIKESLNVAVCAGIILFHIRDN